MAGNQDTNPATPMNNESPVKIYNAVNVVKLSKINPMNGIEKIPPKGNAKSKKWFMVVANDSLPWYK